MNKKKNDWNPNSYLKFQNERTQPSIDLVGRIEMENLQDIIDIGCGPGNSTEILVAKWPHAKILGIDRSPAMIQKAKETYPDQQWQVKDATTIDGKSKYDIVFSNAVIQWIPDHKSLLSKFIDMTRNKGVLAIQMPLFHEMPISLLIDEMYKKQFPNSKFKIDNVFNFHSSNYYYNILHSKVNRLEIWETSYLHIMDSIHKILEMVTTTGMKPYLDNIDNEAGKRAFNESVFDGLNHIYKTEASGKIIFPFKRMFILALK